jgi:putative membrane protein
VVGFSRAIYAAKGWAYYEVNGFFWAKIAAIAVVALLSIIPTIKIIRWHRALKVDAAFLPTAPDIAGVRRYLWAEVAFFALIPVFAAAMARGYGALAH